MNNRDVMIALYEIDSRSLDLLKKYSLKNFKYHDEFKYQKMIQIFFYSLRTSHFIYFILSIILRNLCFPIQKCKKKTNPAYILF